MRTGIVIAVLLVLAGIGVGLLLGRSGHGGPTGSLAAASAPSAAPFTPVAFNGYVNPAPGRAAPTPTPSASTGMGTSALELAEGFRLEICDCDNQLCIDQANHRYVRAMGSIVPGSYGEAAKAEMHAATECIVRLTRSLGDAGP
jgi:hypothetical protein